jgi:3-oxoadipate enol-lactonase
VPYATVGELRICYELRGPEGAPLLAFSNSLGTDLSMWDSQATTLAHEFRILRYDMRGQGKSSVIPGDGSIEQFGRDFIGLIDALNLKRLTFCGLSMGGMIGMWLGVNAPERLDALVLCNTAAKIGTRATWNTRILTVRQEGMKSVSSAVIERWFTPEFRAASSPIVNRAKTMLEASPVEGYVACCAAIRDMDQTNSSSRISVRTLVVAGSEDAVTPPQEGRFLVDHIRGSQYVELDAAHLSNVEQSDAFTSALRDFLPSKGQSHG